MNEKQEGFELINTIIFDVGMVLVHFRWKEYMEEFNFPEHVKNEVIRATFQSKEWNEFDRSLRSDDEIIQSFIQNAPDYENEIRQVVQNLGNTIVTYDYTKSWIKKLKEKGYRIYILSNYARWTYKLTKKQLDFLKACDGALFSFEVNKIKPEAEIFHILTKRFDINPKTAVFLDDNMDNIEAAKALGFSTIHFSSQKKAVEELEKLFFQTEI